MPRLFGTDGVRGVAGKWPLTPDFVRRLGYFAGRVLAARSARPLRSLRGRRASHGDEGSHHRPPSLFVVRDTRRSGPRLQRALSEGLCAAGFRVLDGGVLPTPSVAALVPAQGFTAGAVISASHNPAEFNGIKFFDASGKKLKESWEEAIERGALSEEKIPASRDKSVPARRARADYLNFLRSCWPEGLNLRGLRVAVDCANGATSGLAAELFLSLGARVTALSSRPDGLNINRGCGALHPEALARAVRREKAHFGAAFDGDGDRAILVDEEGRTQDGDSVLLVAARYLKAAGRLRKNLAVVTVMTNLGLYRALEALDVRTRETPVGDKYVWQALEKTGGVLGGEPSGHVIFREYLATGDGMLTALQVLRILRETGRPFSALAALAVRYPQVLKNVPVREKKPLETLAAFNREVEAVRRELGGLGRVLIRYSGTEPLLRIMIEGPDLKRIDGYAESLAAAVRRMKI